MNKRLIALSLCTVSLLSMTACGKGSEGEKERDVDKNIVVTESREPKTDNLDKESKTSSLSEEFFTITGDHFSADLREYKRESMSGVHVEDVDIDFGPTVGEVKPFNIDTVDAPTILDVAEVKNSTIRYSYGYDSEDKEYENGYSNYETINSPFKMTLARYFDGRLRYLIINPDSDEEIPIVNKLIEWMAPCELNKCIETEDSKGYELDGYLYKYNPNSNTFSIRLIGDDRKKHEVNTAEAFDESTKKVLASFVNDDMSKLYNMDNLELDSLSEIYKERAGQQDVAARTDSYVECSYNFNEDTQQEMESHVIGLKLVYENDLRSLPKKGEGSRLSEFSCSLSSSLDKPKYSSFVGYENTYRCQGSEKDMLKAIDELNKKYDADEIVWEDSTESAFGEDNITTTKGHSFAKWSMIPGGSISEVDVELSKYESADSKISTVWGLKYVVSN